MKKILIFSAALGTVIGSAQSENLRLDAPLLGKTETTLGQTITPPRKQLGHEATPVAPKKEEEAPKKAKGQTEITALEATFEQKKNEAVFIGEVVVKDPEFTVNCDRLTAFLKKKAADGPNAAKTSTGPAKATPVPASLSPAADKPKDDSKGGGLDHAIADANPGNIVIIIQDKVESDGSVSHNIGKGKRATYDANSGDIVLTGSPSVQQGINLVLATDEATVMVLNRAGTMTVKGPHKSVIKDTSASDSAR